MNKTSLFKLKKKERWEKESLSNRSVYKSPDVKKVKLNIFQTMMKKKMLTTE